MENMVGNKKRMINSNIDYFTGEYVSRQVKTWRRQYEASKTEEIESMNKVMDWLAENIPEQTKTSASANYVKYEFKMGLENSFGHQPRIFQNGLPEAS